MAKQTAMASDSTSKAYKYTILVIGFISNLIGNGSYVINGLFYAAHLEAFPDQLTLLDIIYGMTYGIGQLMSPMIALLLRSLGERRIVIGCSLCMFSGYVISFFATDARLLLLTFGLMIPIAGEGMFFTPITLVAFNFDKRLTLASGIVASGLGIGLLVSAPLAQLLITSITWRGAALALGAATLNAGALALLIRPRRQSPDPTSAAAREEVENTKDSGGDADCSTTMTALTSICSLDTSLFYFAALFQAFSLVTVINFVPVMAQDQSVPDSRIALYPACYGVAFTLGNLAFGYLGTRFEPFIIEAFSLLMSSLLTSLLPMAMSHAELLGLVIYSGMGACDGCRSALVAELLKIAFGLKFYEICTGLYVATFFFGSFPAPFAGQAMKRIYGSYAPAFYLAAAVFAAAGLAILATWALLRPKRRRAALALELEIAATRQLDQCEPLVVKD